MKNKELELLTRSAEDFMSKLNLFGDTIRSIEETIRVLWSPERCI